MNLRKFRAEDRDFFYELFVKSHERIFAQMPLSSVQREPLMRQQFESKWVRLTNEFSGDEFYVIEVDGKAVGQWFVGEREGQLELVHAALLPEWQGQGLVAKLTRDLARRSISEGRRLRAFVEHENPARHIWYHLGFEVVEEMGPHERIEFFAAAEKYDAFHLREGGEGDAEFLFELFCQSRAAIFESMLIPRDQLLSLQRQQFLLWKRENERCYPKAKSFLVIQNGRRVGVWSYEDSSKGIYILNAVLSPAVRGQGISSRLHRTLFEMADRDGKAVMSHVAMGNPAKEILEHLGLKVVGEAGAYYELRREPKGTAK